MGTTGWLVIAAAAWIAAITTWNLLVVPWLKAGPRRDVVYGIFYRLVQIHARLICRLKVQSPQTCPQAQDPGPLLVIANHTTSIDPALIQVVCPFPIRWMTARSTVPAVLRAIVEYQKVIWVNRDGADMTPLKEAIDQIKDGGVVGMFPEGHIAVPPRFVQPFHEGAGLIVSRTKCPVLLIWIHGTPDTDDVLPALTQRCHAKVTFVDLIKYPDTMKRDEITQDLRHRLAAASGWPLTDRSGVQSPPEPTAGVPLSSR
jgi:1-acyl-sn-glycerol-3-phosphate acyltransferase